MRQLARDAGYVLTALIALMLVGLTADAGAVPHWLIGYLAGLGVVTAGLFAYGLGGNRDE